MFVQMGVNEVAMRVGTPKKLQTALRESDPIPEKLIMSVKVMINDTPSVLSGLGDALNPARSNVLTTPDLLFSKLSERA